MRRHGENLCPRTHLDTSCVISFYIYEDEIKFITSLVIMKLRSTNSLSLHSLVVCWGGGHKGVIMHQTWATSFQVLFISILRLFSSTPWHINIVTMPNFCINTPKFTLLLISQQRHNVSMRNLENQQDFFLLCLKNGLIRGYTFLNMNSRSGKTTVLEIKHIKTVNKIY